MEMSLLRDMSGADVINVYSRVHVSVGYLHGLFDLFLFGEGLAGKSSA